MQSCKTEGLEQVPASSYAPRHALLVGKRFRKTLDFKVPPEGATHYRTFHGNSLYTLGLPVPAITSSLPRPALRWEEAASEAVDVNGLGSRAELRGT